MKQGKGIVGWERQPLNRYHREAFEVEVTFDQRLEDCEGPSHVDVQTHLRNVLEHMQRLGGRRMSCVFEEEPEVLCGMSRTSEEDNSTLRR